MTKSWRTASGVDRRTLQLVAGLLAILGVGDRLLEVGDDEVPATAGPVPLW